MAAKNPLDNLKAGEALNSTNTEDASFSPLFHDENAAQERQTVSSPTTSQKSSSMLGKESKTSYTVRNGAMLALFSVVAVLSAVLCGIFIYSFAADVIRSNAVARGVSLIDGSRSEIISQERKVDATLDWMESVVVDAVGPGPQEKILPLTNETALHLNRTFVQHTSTLMGSEAVSFGAGFQFFYPPLPNVPYPDRAVCGTVGEGCQDKGTIFDHTFTGILSYSYYEDIYRDGSRHQRLGTQHDNRDLLHVHRVDVNRSAQQPVEVKEALFSLPQLFFSPNGSLPQGFHSAIFTWRASDGNPFYFKRKSRFTNIRGNTVLLNAYDFMFFWYRAVSAVIGSDSTDEFLAIIEPSSGFLISFSAEPFGDSRFQQCKEFVAQGDPDLIHSAWDCNALNGTNHPHWFIRGIFNEHNSMIYQNTTKWGKVEGRKMLLLSRLLLQKEPLLKLQLVYGVAESKALGKDFLSRATLIVVLTSLIVLVSTLILGVSSIMMLRQVQSSAILAESLAQHISRYDIESADKELSKYAASGLTRSFRHILDNLGLYKPYLPMSIVLQSQAGSSMSIDTNNASTTTTDLSNSSNPSTNAHNRSGIKESWDRKKRDGTSKSSPFLLQSMFQFRTRTCSIVVIRHIWHVENSKKLSRVLPTTLPCIVERMAENGGIVDHLLGDEVRVSFGVHTTALHHEQSAVKSCFATLESLEEDSRVTFAVASGTAQVGIIGTENIRTRAVIGTPVDIACKIADTQQPLNSNILVSDRTAKVLNHSLNVPVPLGVVQQLGGAPGYAITFEVFESSDELVADIPKDILRVIVAAANNIGQGMHEKALQELGAIPPQSNAIVNTAIAHLEHGAGAATVAETLAKQRKGSVAHSDGTASTHTQNSTQLPARSLQRGPKKQTEQPTIEEVVRSAQHSEYKEQTEEEGGVFSLFLPVEQPNGESSPSAASMGELPFVVKDLEGFEWFRLKAMLGQGATSTVYTAINMATGRFAAMKVLPVANADQFEQQEILKEIKILGTLHHENELLGSSLRKVLNDSYPLPFPICLSILEQIAAGMQYVHEKKCLHLDLKPENCLLSLDGSVKICDFGSSVDLMQSLRNSATGEQQLYLPGTIGYIAPEVGKGATPCAASDVYSFGILAFFVCTGIAPWRKALPRFSAVDLIQVMAQQSAPDTQPTVSHSLSLREKLQKHTVEEPKERLRVQSLLEFAQTMINHDKSKRPTFREICEKLAGMH